MVKSESSAAVRACGLMKWFPYHGGRVEAVRGIDLEVGSGEIFGLLGPNGAGKTTTLRMLATLLAIDGGDASVAGIDVVRHPEQVRRRIGYVGQRGGADLAATGRENLLLQARLFGASRREAIEQSDNLIASFALAEFADRTARTYSGGQRRRLEVALGVINRPRVLFLDEPTLGLDPQNRANLWDRVRALREAGTTVVLTTHYLDEADALADRVAIIDRGHVVADGSPAALKQQIAGDCIVIKPKPAIGPLDGVRTLLASQAFVHEASPDGDTVRLYVPDAPQALPRIVDLLEAKGVEIEMISLSAPSLNDVFLRKTGRSLRDARTEPQEVVA